MFSRKIRLVAIRNDFYTLKKAMFDLHRYPLQLCLIKSCFFCFFNQFIFICGFSVNVICAFLAYKKWIEKVSKLKHFQVRKPTFDQNKISRVPLPSLHGGSLEITLTASLSYACYGCFKTKNIVKIKNIVGQNIEHFVQN